MRSILAAVMQAILWALSLPLALLGILRKPTARDLAASLLADTPPASAAAAPEESFELGELIRGHANRRYFGARSGDAPLAELPVAVAAWLDRMDRQAMYRAAMTPARLLEAHIAAGPDGQLRSLGLVAKRPDVPATEPAPARSENLSEILADLGYAPIVHRVVAAG